MHTSDVVQFLGYSSVLVIAWFGARQVSIDPPENWKWLGPYRILILPITMTMLAMVH